MAADRPDTFAEPASEVEVTILPDPAARSVRERIVGIRMSASRWLVLAIVLTAGAGLTVLANQASGPHRARSRAAATEAVNRGVLGIATAYGQRLHCVRVTFAIDDPTYARADFDRANPCGQYDGDATAIFHRVGGVWRPVLDAVSFPCPVRSLPARVQIELSVCPTVPAHDRDARRS